MRSFEKFRRNFSERSSSPYSYSPPIESRRPSIVIDLSRFAFGLRFIFYQDICFLYFLNVSLRRLVANTVEIELIDNDEGIFSIFKFLSLGRDRENERRVI